MTNRLAGEKSPYLMQHAENPVDWYPWGAEALDRARREDKPILVSIGYSACHWCHVMAHECFEDDAIAGLMNDHFVNIKVDREERPDVDAIYMEAVQAMSGQGGWPLNVFLAPDGRPFYGGTYFPPSPRHGMPSWPELLQMVAEAYTQRRSEVLHNSNVLTRAIAAAQNRQPEGGNPGVDVLQQALSTMLTQRDLGHGGFGGAPKFPQPLALDFLLRMAAKTGREDVKAFVELTLRSMGEGGIYDQLGGGFHRYTVDGAWLVPHFEKMLYDNALLVRVYVAAFQLTGNPWYRQIAEESLGYLLRDLRSPAGAFYSAEDADSEGIEGKWYVWTQAEIEDICGAEAPLVLQRYGVTESGNFEGKMILTSRVPIREVAEHFSRSIDDVTQQLEQARARLFDARKRRVPPGKDIKVLTSWNALAIRALAEASRVFDRPEYLAAARQALHFLWTEMRPGGTLKRSWQDGPSSVDAFLEDYAYLIEALVTLYETAFEPGYLSMARELAAEMVDRFWDDEAHILYDTSKDAEALIVRPRNLFDNPIPSGNAAAISALLRLEALTGDSGHSRIIEGVLAAVGDLLSKAPTAFPAMLSALDFSVSTPAQIGIVGDTESERTLALVRAVYASYVPNKVVSVGPGDETPLLAGRGLVDGKPAAYVCEHFACQTPVTDPDALVI